VKWRWKRGCLLSHALTLGCLWVASLSRINQVDLQALGDLTVDRLYELQELDVTVAWEALLCRIATNVCVDMLSGRSRRALPVDASLDPSRSRVADADADPAELTMLRETLRLALVALLEDPPPRQRAVLILREALQWRGSEIAELLGMSVASVSSVLQRARSTLASSTAGSSDRTPMRLDESQRAVLMRYVKAFQNHDIEAPTSLVQEDLQASVTPPDLLAAAA
jgi:RNA polymerase sigma-70 factor, ECF subfamily